VLVVLLAAGAVEVRADFLLTSANDLNNTSTNNVSRYDLPAPNPIFGWFHSDSVAITHPLGMGLSADHLHAYVATGTGATDGAILSLNVNNLSNMSQFNTSTTSPLGEIFGMAVSPKDGMLYVADQSNNKIIRFNSSGVGTDVVTGATSPGLVVPTGLVFSADGNSLYVANESGNPNAGNAYIDKYDTSTFAAPSSHYATGLSGYTALSLTPDGRYLYAATGPVINTTTDHVVYFDTTQTNPAANSFADTGSNERVMAMAWTSPNDLFDADYTAGVNTSRIVHYNVSNNTVVPPVTSYHEGGFMNGLTGMVFVPASPANVPEPGSLSLVLLGSLGVLGYRWRRKRTAVRA